jgi:predicted N-acetyltransferase YhbS
LRYVLRLTSELSQPETDDILTVLNRTYEPWGGEEYFLWKYLQNPYGESLHIIGYDGDKPVANESFWRNDLGDQRAYQSCDTAVLPSHQGQGIFRQSVTKGVERLKGEYLYGFPNIESLPGFLNFGWSLKQNLRISFHLAGRLLSRFEDQEPIPDEYARWRFVNHPRKQYYICRRKGRPYLLSMRRKSQYVVGGPLSQDFGLEEVRPLLLFSYDLPGLKIRLPRRIGYVIENTCYADYPRLIPSYRDDTL